MSSLHRAAFAGPAGRAILEVGNQLVVGNLEGRGLFLHDPIEFFIRPGHLGGSQSFEIKAQRGIVHFFEFKPFEAAHPLVLGFLD